eukprot:TRINITY_DN27130_c0_g1_i1.p1 TRINITY_DN27130_c0_g1~~TRINITY_DN27130_c0_g1_i1.p1  ORF type:complete len:554 (+),score=153.44 TRINITY_DN27130_c0_g1_i1:49-1662(+)
MAAVMPAFQMPFALDKLIQKGQRLDELDDVTWNTLLAELQTKPPTCEDLCRWMYSYSRKQKNKLNIRFVELIKAYQPAINLCKCHHDLVVKFKSMDMKPGSMSPMASPLGMSPFKKSEKPTDQTSTAITGALFYAVPEYRESFLRMAVRNGQVILSKTNRKHMPVSFKHLLHGTVKSPECQEIVKRTMEIFKLVKTSKGSVELRGLTFLESFYESCPKPEDDSGPEWPNTDATLFTDEHLTTLVQEEVKFTMKDLQNSNHRRHRPITTSQFAPGAMPPNSQFHYVQAPQGMMYTPNRSIPISNMRPVFSGYQSAPMANVPAPHSSLSVAPMGPGSGGGGPPQMPVSATGQPPVVEPGSGKRPAQVMMGQPPAKRVLPPNGPVEASAEAWLTEKEVDMPQAVLHPAWASFHDFVSVLGKEVGKAHGEVKMDEHYGRLTLHLPDTTPQYHIPDGTRALLSCAGLRAVLSCHGEQGVLYLLQELKAFPTKDCTLSGGVVLEGPRFIASLMPLYAVNNPFNLYVQFRVSAEGTVVEFSHDI